MFSIFSTFPKTLACSWRERVSTLLATKTLSDGSSPFVALQSSLAARTIACRLAFASASKPTNLSTIRSSLAVHAAFSTFLVLTCGRGASATAPSLILICAFEGGSNFFGPCRAKSARFSPVVFLAGAFDGGCFCSYFPGILDMALPNRNSTHQLIARSSPAPCAVQHTPFVPHGFIVRCMMRFCATHDEALSFAVASAGKMA